MSLSLASPVALPKAAHPNRTLPYTHTHPKRWREILYKLLATGLSSPAPPPISIRQPKSDFCVSV